MPSVTVKAANDHIIYTVADNKFKLHNSAVRLMQIGTSKNATLNGRIIFTWLIAKAC